MDNLCHIDLKQGFANVEDFAADRVLAVITKKSSIRRFSSILNIKSETIDDEY